MSEELNEMMEGVGFDEYEVEETEIEEPDCEPSENAEDVSRMDESLTALVRLIAANLVDNPDEIKLEVKQGERNRIIELTVSPDDMGKVIGKQGRIAKAIRSVVKAASLKGGRHYVLDIM